MIRIQTYRSLRVPVKVFLLLAFLLVCAGRTTSAKSSYVLKPPPAWVQNVQANFEERIASETQGDVLYLLFDNQIRVSDTTVERYTRRVEKVITTSGLDTVSQLSFDFEPSYEELIIHHIQIHRGTEIINALKPREIKLIQQERDLDQQLYNGTFSAIIFLNDVRQGDIVDFAYSVNGQNPVIKGHYSDRFYLRSGAPVQHLRWRLLYNANRPLHIKDLNTDAQPVTRTTAGETEYLWEQQDVAAIEFEDATPSWHQQTPVVQVSNFADWREVAQWALPLFQSKQGLSAKLQSQLAKWRNQSAEKPQLLLQALRFVQDEVRYLGVELGEYSHQPVQPVAVFERRFGDCKDKSLLLTTILQEFGIEACPALVNTSAGRALDNWQPMAFAFDHCIVQAKLDGKTYWLDPTISNQRGDLSSYYDPNYERALLVKDDSRALIEIPTPVLDGPTTEIKQIYSVPNNRDATVLLVITTAHGADADGLRARLAAQSLAELSKSYVNYYAEYHHSIQADGLPSVRDDEKRNILTITERYLIADFWSEKERNVYADRIYYNLDKPTISRRTTPLALQYPLHLSQNIEINLPTRFAIQNEAVTISDDFIRFDYRFISRGTSINLDYEVKTLRDSVANQKVADYLATLDKINQYLGYQFSGNGTGLTTPVSKGMTLFRALLALGILVTPFLVVGLIAFAVNRRSRRRLATFRQKFESAAGEEPAKAIPVSNEQQILWHLSNLRCSCGRNLYYPELSYNRETMLFDGQRLTVLTMPCGTCGKSRDVYFHFADAGNPLMR